MAISLTPDLLGAELEIVWAGEDRKVQLVGFCDKSQVMFKVLDSGSYARRWSLSWRAGRDAVVSDSGYMKEDDKWLTTWRAASDFHVNKVITHPKGNSMSIVNFIKNLGLDADDKLMIELGLEDPSGVPTSTGKEAMELLMYKENRAKLVEQAKALKAEQDKEKEKKS